VYAASENENAVLENVASSKILRARMQVRILWEPRVSQSINRRRNQTMTSFKILSAAAILSMMTAPPLFAQAAIGEPGAYAFYHPNADVLNAGRPLPRETAGAMASVPFRGSNAYAGTDSGANASCARRYRSYDPGSGTFLGHDGHRHPCE
jgi:BA14K-like protein